MALSLVASLAAGAVSDRIGRRPVLVAWGAALALLAYPLMSLMARGEPGSIIAGQVGLALLVAERVLDIAAGLGLFGIAVALANPNATVIAQDWENVLAVARENAEKSGVANRLRLLSGSAFEVDFGAGLDLVLMPNFLHHFDPATCVALLRKVHDALVPGGRVAIVEFVPDESRVTPAIPAAFSLKMLAHTPGGDAYTYAELDRMCRDAGFTATEVKPLPPMPQSLVLARRRTR
jgi:ubiquinone/menaquinone biosynthesis C-methylase UbiE